MGEKSVDPRNTESIRAASTPSTSDRCLASIHAGSD